MVHLLLFVTGRPHTGRRGNHAGFTLGEVRCEKVLTFLSSNISTKKLERLVACQSWALLKFYFQNINKKEMSFWNLQRQCFDCYFLKFFTDITCYISREVKVFLVSKFS